MRDNLSQQHRDGLIHNSGSPGNLSLKTEQPAIPNKKLRLLYISNPNIIHTRRWVSWFASRGHSVCLLADVPIKNPWPDIEVKDLSKFFYAPIIRFPVWAVWLKEFIRQWRPDILHAHRVNSAGWLAAASGFHPFVVTPWGSDVLLGPERSWLADLLARFTLRNADKVTIISQAIAKKVVALGARQETLVNIYFGVDLDTFSPRSISGQDNLQLRRRLGLPESASLIFSPRAIQPIYNQDTILQAMPGVLERIPQACLIFNAYNTDPEYKQKLDDLIEQLRLAGSIRWLPATSDPREMADRYNLSDVVVSVPGSDGAPVSVMEAMACGKPVICSDLPALREVITNCENGLIVPVRDESQLAETIIHALQKPGLAVEVGQNAHRLVAERANLDVEMQRMEIVYNQLAGVKKD